MCPSAFTEEQHSEPIYDFVVDFHITKLREHFGAFMVFAGHEKQ